MHLRKKNPLYQPKIIRMPSLFVLRTFFPAVQQDNHDPWSNIKMSDSSVIYEPALISLMHKSSWSTNEKGLFTMLGNSPPDAIVRSRPFLPLDDGDGIFIGVALYDPFLISPFFYDIASFPASTNWVKGRGISVLWATTAHMALLLTS